MPGGASESLRFVSCAPLLAVLVDGTGGIGGGGGVGEAAPDLFFKNKQ